MSNTLAMLEKVLAARKSADPKDSYVASLHAKGLNNILKKIGEEATEVILSAKDAQTATVNKEATSTKEVIAETADLWFHCLVMLSHLGISQQTILDELERRFELSGLVEKANREQRKIN